MDFRLIYRGSLKATQRDPVPGSVQRSAHWQLKHRMRREFHRQLKTIWNINKVLLDKKDDDGSILGINRLALAHQVPPWSFVPLVTSELQMLCGLDFLLLRRDHPGSSVWSGDMDNRIKTLIDALEVPDEQSGYGADIPIESDYNPMFCLVQSDKLVTSLSVETARLLDAPPEADTSYAEVHIHVRLRPENVTLLNIGL